MGFLEAIRQMGTLDAVGDRIESYLKYPLEEGRVIRVFLDIEDPMARQLKVRGVKRIDLADIDCSPEMKRKYLYRDRVGSNVFWGFAPLHRIGKPKKTAAANRTLFFGKQGDWKLDKDAQFRKIRDRVLDDYEKEEIFAAGSVENIMRDLPPLVENLVEQLEPGVPHVVLFGTEENGRFVYPGEIPVLVRYFENKLKESLKQSTSGGFRPCALCRKQGEVTTTLDKTFKFATFDKVNILPGLSKAEAEYVFPVCLDCMGRIAAGRERVERTLSNSRVIPGINVWVVPEGSGPTQAFRSLVRSLEYSLQRGRPVEERMENAFFHHLARQEGEGLIFHFLFVERNQSQEIVHLLVEDVPPERLVLLEKCWKDAFGRVMGEKARKGRGLDWAFGSLYFLLIFMAGHSNADQIVFRDFTLKMLAKMLQGKKLPVSTLKRFLTSRIPRLVHETPRWDNVQKVMLYGQIWVEYMTRLNEEVSV